MMKLKQPLILPGLVLNLMTIKMNKVVIPLVSFVIAAILCLSCDSKEHDMLAEDIIS